MFFKFPRQLFIYLVIPVCSTALFGQNIQPCCAMAAAMGVTTGGHSLFPSELPNAPSSHIDARSDMGGSAPQQTGMTFVSRTAPKYADTIEPGYQAQHLDVQDKVILSVRELFSIRYLAGDLIEAGYSHAANTDPKYGTNRQAFAQRFGASAASSASQTLFSDGLLAPVLHQDPRYYVMGNNHRLVTRFLYAASSVVIARRDNGNRTINFADLSGYAGSAALAQVYYPKGHRGVDVMLTQYGTSLGGLALQNEAVEFFHFLVRHQPR